MYQESNYLKTTDEDYLYTPDSLDQEALPEEKPRFSGMPLLFIIQIVVCTIVVLTVLLFKMIGGENYERFRSWYLKESNQTVIATSDLTQYAHVLEQFGKDLTGKNPADASSQEAASAAAGAVSSSPPPESAASPEAGEGQ